MTQNTRRPLIAGNWKMNLGGRQGLDHLRQLSDIDGALVGGSSLKPDELAAIWRSAQPIAVPKPGS